MSFEPTFSKLLSCEKKAQTNKQAKQSCKRLLSTKNEGKTEKNEMQMNVIWKSFRYYLERWKLVFKIGNRNCATLYNLMKKLVSEKHHHSLTRLNQKRQTFFCLEIEFTSVSHLPKSTSFETIVIAVEKRVFSRGQMSTVSPS